MSRAQANRREPPASDRSLPARALPGAQQRRRLLLLGALSLVTLLGALLRLWRADWALPFVPHPDEPAIMNTVLSMLRTGDPNPHFFMYPSLWLYLQAVVGWLHLRWGINHGLYTGVAQLPLTTDIVTSAPGFFVWGRTATALVGAATIPALYSLTRRLGGALAGMIAASMLAINTLHLIHSHYIMTDIACEFFTTLALIATLRLYSQGRWRDYILAGSLAGLAAGAKHQAALAAVAIVAASLARGPTAESRGILYRLAQLVAAAASMIGVFLLTSPYIVLAFDEFRADLAYQLADYARGAHGDVAGRWPWRAYLDFYRERAIGGVGGVLVIWGAVRLAQDRDRRALILWSLVLAYLLIFLPQGNHWMRNLLPTQPPLFAIVGIGAADVLRRLQRRLAPASAAPLGALLLLGLLLAPAQEASQYLQRLHHGDSRVAFLRWAEAHFAPGVQVAAELKPVPGDERWSEAAYLPQHDLAWYRQQGFAYIVSSSDTWRQYAMPEPYQRLTGAPPVAEFGGPDSGMSGPRLIVSTTQLTPEAPPVRLEAATVFGGARLRGAILGAIDHEATPVAVQPTRTFRAGEPLGLRTFWQVDRPFDRDYFIFVHVVDQAGTTIAQRDAPPWQGRAPTSSWQPGTLVVDLNDLVLPPGVAPGDYAVQVGMFDPVSGQAPPLIIDGQAQSGNAITLTTISVTP